MNQFKTVIARQQQILTYLGYYSGKIDGIWGPKCIEAKKQFENLRAFVPGLPNGGLPFADQPPYPKGIIRGKYQLLELVGVAVEQLPPLEIVESPALPEISKIAAVEPVVRDLSVPIKRLIPEKKPTTYEEEDLSAGSSLNVE